MSSEWVEVNKSDRVAKKHARRVKAWQHHERLAIFEAIYKADCELRLSRAIKAFNESEPPRGETQAQLKAQLNALVEEAQHLFALEKDIALEAFLAQPT